MAPGLPAYVYEPLPTPTSIRLFAFADIDPAPQPTIGENDANALKPIKCTIHVFDLNDLPEFDALSYTWGNPYRVYHSVNDADVASQKYGLPGPNHCTLIIDGHSLPVGANLFDYLKRMEFGLRHYPDVVMLRETGRLKAKYTWIDAICIDQSDVLERNQQVTLMDRIYKDAQSVIIWLGDEEFYTRLAVSALLELTRLPPGAIEVAKRTNVLHGNMAAVGLPPLQTSNWWGVYAFLNRTWFCRAWVVQEAVLAQKLVVMTGSIIAPWIFIFKSVRFLYDSGWWGHIQHSARLYMERGVTNSLLASFMPVKRFFSPEEAETGRALYQPEENQAFDPIYTVTEIQSARFGLGRQEMQLTYLDERVPPTTLSLLMRFRNWETLDPRDRIYAFLGLDRASSSRSSIIPDYNKPIEEVYAEACLHLIRSNKNLKILSAVQDESLTRLPNLPSWVPDFTARVPGVRIGTSSFCPWSACGDRPMILLEQDSSETTLQVEGAYLDTLLNTAEFSNDDLSTVLPVLRHLRPYYTSYSLEESDILWVSPPNSGEGAPEASEDAKNSDSESDAAKEPFLVAIPYRTSSSLNAPKSRIQSRIEVFWRTLITDVCERQHPAPLEYGFAFSYELHRSASDATLLALVRNMSIAERQAKHDENAEKSDNYGDNSNNNDPAALLSTARLRTDAFYVLDADEPGTFLNLPSLRRLEADLRGCTIVRERGSTASDQQAALGEQQELQNSERLEVIPDISLGPTRFLPSPSKVFMNPDDDDYYTKSYNSQSPDSPSTAQENVGADAAEAAAEEEKAAANLHRRAFNSQRGSLGVHRALFSTSSRRLLGLGPQSMRAGDEVWLLSGADVPFVLRPVVISDSGSRVSGDDADGGRGDGEGNEKNGKKSYRVVGECYVHGLMHGEALEGAGPGADVHDDNEVRFENIVLE